MFEKQEKEYNKIITELVISNKSMFYGLFLSETNWKFTKDVKTASCGKHTNAPIIEMRFNPDFWDTLNHKERTFLILHECEHYIALHWEFSKLFNLSDRYIANLAYDISINSNILQLVDYISVINGAILIETFPELKLERNKDSVYYYNELLKGKEEYKQKGSSGCPNLDDLLKDEENTHITWKELEGITESEKEIIKRQLKSSIQKIVEDIKSKSNGYIPQHINDIDTKFDKIEEVISWKSLFKRIVSNYISTETYSTYKKQNRRFIDFPGYKNKTSIKILTGVDESGSMDKSSLDDCNGQIYHMWKSGAIIDKCSWDGAVSPATEYKGTMSYTRQLQGDTDVNCFLSYINDNYRKQGWNMAICLTDGYFSTPTVISKIPVLFVITKNGTHKNLNNYKYVKIN